MIFSVTFVCIWLTKQLFEFHSSGDIKRFLSELHVKIGRS